MARWRQEATGIPGNQKGRGGSPTAPRAGGNPLGQRFLHPGALQKVTSLSSPGWGGYTRYLAGSELRVLNVENCTDCQLRAGHPGGWIEDRPRGQETCSIYQHSSSGSLLFFGYRFPIGGKRGYLEFPHCPPRSQILCLS